MGVMSEPVAPTPVDTIAPIKAAIDTRCAPNATHYKRLGIDCIAERTKGDDPAVSKFPTIFSQ